MVAFGVQQKKQEPMRSATTAGPAPIQGIKQAKPAQENQPDKVEYRCKKCNKIFKRNPSVYKVVQCPWCGAMLD